MNLPLPRRPPPRALVTAAVMTVFFGCSSKSTKSSNPVDGHAPAGDGTAVSDDSSTLADAGADPSDAEVADAPSDAAADSDPDGLPETGGLPDDLCNPTPPNGYHTIHFRYLWAGKQTFTLFPKPELMPDTVELKLPVMCNSVTCTREQDRPWFNCPVPDSYFATRVGWIVSDRVQSDWTTAVERPMPSTPKEYWLRWHYGLPTTLRSQDPPDFEFLDEYPDGAFADWAATGSWNDSMCAKPTAPSPATLGFAQGGWFPYKNRVILYPYGASLAYAYDAQVSQAQEALDRVVFERYQLWKRNWVRSDSEACGAGTARVASDGFEGTFSEQQGYGMVMSAALGDKELFGKLWSFVRRTRSQEKFCGLAAREWRTPADCQPLDSFASSGDRHDSAFSGDAEIGMGLVYAALQWPEFAEAASDWLLRMECEVNSSYGDGFNYPSKGDAWDKTCQGTGSCGYAPGTVSQISSGSYFPGHFRVFGDFLGKQLGAQATATNGQSHPDFWYKTAETVYELIERCYDEPGVHPGLIGHGGDILRPCQEAADGKSQEWTRALGNLGIDAAWFGGRVDLPEIAVGSSRHSPGKSRMQAKIDQAQGFFADFHKKNPPEPNANRFSSLCSRLTPAGTVTDCDATLGHNASTVNLALCVFASSFNNDDATTVGIRREALEESLTATMLDQNSDEEALGVTSLLFLTGNFPNPMNVPGK